MHRAVPSALSMLRSAALGAAAAILVVTSLQVAAVPAAEFTNPASFLSGTSPSGIAWSAVATGSSLPIRSSGTNNGAAGAVAYFDTTTGRIQIDPKGWNLSLFNITYTTGTVNTTGTTPGPFAYVTGTSPTSSVVSTATGAAGQRTVPAGTWTLITCAPARIAGTVSLTNSPTLTTTYDPGNGAANASSTYTASPDGTPAVAGWFNQPWSFPYVGDAANSGTGLVKSGSAASMSIQNFKTFGVSGNANANILGYGNYQATFQYTISGITGNQVGAMIPYASTIPPKDLIWNTTSGTWNTSATDWTTSGGGSYAFAAGDSVTFSGTAGGTVTLSGSLAPSAVTVSATAGTYTLQSSSGNQITGTTGLTKTGVGTLVLAGPNAYSGTTNLQAGTIRAGSDGAFGTGTLDLDGGTLASDGAAARSFSNPVAIGGNVTFGDGTGTGAVTLAGGVDLGGATRSLTTVANTIVSGTISNGGLTKLGSGTLTLTAANTFTGATTVGAGTLALTGSGGIAASSTVTVASGATLDVSGVTAGWQVASGQTLTGAGSVVGPATGAVGSVVDPGSVGGVGTLSATGGFTLLGDLTIDILGGTIDLLDGATGTLSIAGGSVNFNTLSAPVGNLVFAKYLSLTGPAFASVSGLPTGYTLDYNYLGGNQIALVLASPPGVPEIDPVGLGSVIAMVSGTLGLVERRRWRRRSPPRC
jgi:autotransporter-associated beta strand protein